MLVLVPLGVMGWLALRLQNNENVVVQHQTRQLGEARLQEASRTIDDFVLSMQNDANRMANHARTILEDNDVLEADKPAKLRDIVRASPILEQIYIADSGGERLFPPLDSTQITNKEVRFLRQTSDLWPQQELFEKLDSEESLTEPTVTKKLRSNSILSRDRQEVHLKAKGVEVNGFADQGWLSWDLGAQTYTFYWVRDQRERLIVLQLSRAYWLSLLLADLPHNVQSNIEFMNISLLNRRQNRIYQWGALSIGCQNPPARCKPATPSVVAQKMLVPPLEGWRLEYSTINPLDDSWTRFIIYLLLFSFMGLVLAVLAWVIWREHRKELQIAAQRVTFVNQVSHELKTPLTNICMYAELLESNLETESPMGDTRLQKYSRILVNESQRLGRLINNVLSFSKSGENKLKLNMREGVANDVIRKTVRLFEPAFELKKIDVKLELDTAKLTLFDAEALEQILNNLLSNIEKYAADGGVARLRSKYVDDQVMIEVEDAGPGVDDVLHIKIFQPFERGNSSLTEGVSGTGIGLGIARDLCRLHGGDLNYQPAKEASSGACFVINIHSPEIE